MCGKKQTARKPKSAGCKKANAQNAGGKKANAKIAVSRKGAGKKTYNSAKKGGQIMLYFENDYSEGAYEDVLKRLIETNMEQTVERCVGIRDGPVYIICKGEDLCCMWMSGRGGISSDRRNADKSDCDQFHAGFT